MEAVVLSQDKKEDWDKFVYAHPNTISWHVFDFYKVIEMNYQIIYYPLAVYDTEKICGILPLYHVKTTLTKDLLISCPYVVAGGIIADDAEVRKTLLDKAVELSKQHNSCRIILKQYKIKNDLDLLTDDNFYNCELNLAQSESELWEGFHENNKHNILQAEKYELVLEYPSTDIDSFYNVVFTQHHKKGIPCPSRKWIESKWKFGDYSYKIGLLKFKGKTVAVTMTKQFKKTVSFPYSAILVQDPQHKMFMYKLYWELIKRLSNEKLEIFHSGRIPKTGIADEYRLGWGGTKHTYYYQYYPNTGAKTEFAVKRGKKRVLFEKVWRMMPKWFVRMIGPAIVKQFP